MAKVYVMLIKAGRRTLEDVPAKLKEEVSKLLEAN